MTALNFQFRTDLQSQKRKNFLDCYFTNFFTQQFLSTCFCEIFFFPSSQRQKKNKQIDLGIITINEDSTLPRSPELEPDDHQMQLDFIFRASLWMVILACYEEYSQHILSSADKMLIVTKVMERVTDVI